jgi:hypothetical protein
MLQANIDEKRIPLSITFGVGQPHTMRRQNMFEALLLLPDDCRLITAEIVQPRPSLWDPSKTCPFTVAALSLHVTIESAQQLVV